MSKIVKPPVDTSKLPVFFWEHLLEDLQCLQTSLKINFQDAALLVHKVIAQIVETPGMSISMYVFILPV